MNKQLQQKLAKAQNTLREVESRGWYSILLSLVDPINEGGEAVKLIKITACFQDFTREFADANIETKLEAYAVLRAAYDNRKFPTRKHVSKAQFERLLDIPRASRNG